MCTSLSGRAGIDSSVNMLRLRASRLVEGLLERMDAFALQTAASKLMALGILLRAAPLRGLLKLVAIWES